MIERIKDVLFKVFAVSPTWVLKTAIYLWPGFPSYHRSELRVILIKRQKGQA